MMNKVVYIMFIVFYFILFCSAPLYIIVSQAIQIHFVIVTVIELHCLKSNQCPSLTVQTY